MGMEVGPGLLPTLGFGCSRGVVVDEDDKDEVGTDSCDAAVWIPFVLEMM